MSNHEFEELQIKQYSNRTRAFIKIQEGCNQFCSYCIIPYARGPVRSRAKDDVVREIKELAHNGFKEIILVGIHVASYGVDLGDTTLESLIMETISPSYKSSKSCATTSIYRSNPVVTKH